MHDKNLVHRDLKVDNILVMDKDLKGNILIAKLTDFTITERLTPEDLNVYNGVGNPNFKAPENCTYQQGGFLGKPTDIWSLGLCMYVFVTE
jgi:serine/threonine-protein kinase Chk2